MPDEQAARQRLDDIAADVAARRARAIVTLAHGFRCARCWKVRQEVGLHFSHPHLCQRCIGVVTGEEPDIHELAERAFDLAFQEALAIGVPRGEAVRRAGAINRLGPLARLPMGDWQHA